ncbi:MAG: MATE family efflux transporter, partial [Clostridia bacterium]|nr:MATE family efflux transporter [Clostridia bacterium]
MPETVENTNENILGTEKISKLIIKFSIPTIITLIINNLYNMVDQIFIGQGVGMLGNGATNIIAPISTAAIALSSLIGDGLASFFSLHLGKNQPEKCAKSVGNAILMSIIVSVIITVPVIIALEPICLIFGATEGIMPYALDYGRIIVCGFPVLICSTVINASIRVDGSPRFAMVAMMVGAILNMGLDPLFIFVFDWGVKGAAAATVIGQIINLIINIIYLFRYKNIKLNKHCFKLELKIIGKILGFGFASGLNALAGTIIGLASNRLLTKYGAQSIYGENIPITTFGLVMKVYMLLVSVSMGLAVGTQPIIGYNYGAGKNDRVKKAFFLAVGLTSIWQVLTFIIYESCPIFLIRIFGTESALYEEFAVKCFRIYLMCSFLGGVQLCASTLFQALGKPIIATIVSLTKNVIFFVPAMFILAYLIGLDGVLWAGMVADICAFLLSGTVALIS